MKEIRRVLVTGATKGIGRQIAIAFKEQGHKVIIGYINDEQLAIELEKKHGIKGFKWDVSDFVECQKILPEIEKALDGNVEILVNNAGITMDKMLHKQDPEGWNKVITNNLTSVFNMSRIVIEGMRAHEYGRIISISSVNAHGAAGQTNYASSKAGIEGFTKSLALEGAKLGITVNAIAPGYIDTEMVRAIPSEILETIVSKVPMKRLGRVEEIAETALFLASPGASFITGAVIPVNGGLHM